MATLMDWLLQRQARGYASPTDSVGPGILEILSQNAARGYPESPEMYRYRTGAAQPPAQPLQTVEPGYTGAAGRRLSGAVLAQQPQPGYAPPQYSAMGGGYDTPREMMPPSGAGTSGSFRALPGYEGEGSALFNTFRSLPGYEGEGMPQPTAARGRQVAQAPMGPVNMNVIKGLNQYAQMGDPQAYADQFAKGDLSKVKARTYRNEDGTTWNDYYVSGLLGG